MSFWYCHLMPRAWCKCRKCLSKIFRLAKRQPDTLDTKALPQSQDRRFMFTLDMYMSKLLFPKWSQCAYLLIQVEIKYVYQFLILMMKKIIRFLMLPFKDMYCIHSKLFSKPNLMFMLLRTRINELNYRNIEEYNLSKSTTE